MATLTREFLTGTGDGTGFKVVGTTLVGRDTIHTVPTVGIIKDTIILAATNNDTVARTVTIVWGDATAVDDEITFTIQPKAGAPPLLELSLDEAKIVAAYAEVTNVIVIHGYVNRIDETP